MLRIDHVVAQIGEKRILKELSLDLPKGQIHAIMGPNGVGKSTLAALLSGREDVICTEGTIQYNGKDLLTMAPEIRAREGLFIAFQHPVAIPGISTKDLLRVMLNEHRKYQGLPPVDVLAFETLLAETVASLDLTLPSVERQFNVGFSGGEKKRNELLQIAMLAPKCVILDELDSGLDLDAVRTMAQTLRKILPADSTMLVITHYPQLIEYLKPDAVHIMHDGAIVHSGTWQLAFEVQEKGYGHVLPTEL